MLRADHLSLLYFLLGIPSSQSQSCPAPIGVLHAQYPSCSGGSSIPPGQQCETACGEGYTASNALTCQGTGQMSPATFSCSENYCAAPIIDNGASPNSCAEGPWIAHRSICSTRCKEGWLPAPSDVNDKSALEELACSLGSFYPPTFRCRPIERADTPSGFQITNRMSTSMTLNWASGDLNDCIFSKYVVKMRVGNEPETDAPFCSRLKWKEQGECTVTDLPSLTTITFKIATECVNALANSDNTQEISDRTTGVNVETRPPRGTANAPTIVYVKPDMIMLMFSQGVQLKQENGPFQVELCNTGPDFPGDNLTAHCDNDCIQYPADTSDASFTMLPQEESQFAFWTIAAGYPWKVRCQYKVTLDNMFETSEAPRTDVNVEPWEFQYEAEPPKLEEGKVKTENCGGDCITQTSIQISVTWDKTCRFRCFAEYGLNSQPTPWGPRIVAAPGQPSDYTIGSTGKDDAMKLVPYMEYTILCEAALVDDELAVTKNPEVIGTVTTLPERDNFLSSLQAFANPQCEDSTQQAKCQVPGASKTCELDFNGGTGFAPGSYEYRSALTTVDHADQCEGRGPTNQSQGRWQIVVQWEARGDYSTTSVNTECGLISSGSRSQSCIMSTYLEVKDEPVANQHVAITVKAQDPDMPANVYVFNVTALALQLTLSSVTITTHENVVIQPDPKPNAGLAAGFTNVRSAGPSQLPWTMQFEVTSNDNERMKLIWSRVGLKIGGISQTAAPGVLDGAEPTYRRYRTDPNVGLVGIGTNLDVDITVLGSPVLTLKEKVSFETPVLTCIDLSSDCSGCPQDGTLRSPLSLDFLPNVANQPVCVQGNKFGSPVMNNCQAGNAYQCPMLEIKIMSANQEINTMCTNSRYVGELQTGNGAHKHTCDFTPLSDTIQLEIWGPIGPQHTTRGRLGATYILKYAKPKFSAAAATPAVLTLEDLSTPADGFELKLLFESLPYLFWKSNADTDPMMPKLRLGNTDLCQDGTVTMPQISGSEPKEIICKVVQHLVVDKVCNAPDLHASWGELESDAPSGVGKLRIKEPEIVNVMGDPLLVGNNLQYTITGQYFGEDHNGGIEVFVGDRPCDLSSRNDTTITCVVAAGPLRDDLTDRYPFFNSDRDISLKLGTDCQQPNEGEGFNQSNQSYANMSYANMSCDVPVVVMLGRPCETPVKDAVRSDSDPSDPDIYKSYFKECEPGKRRPNISEDSCESCSVGRAQPYQGPVTNCRECDLNQYQDEEGQPICKECPANTLTRNIGTNKSELCWCKPGFYVMKSFRETWIASGYEGDVECVACMNGADCKGDMVIPVSENGWHMVHGVEYEAEECAFRKGCLYNNTCAEGYISEKCDKCDEGFYTNIGFSETTCDECTAWIMTIGYLMPAILAVVFITVILPVFMWRLQAEWSTPDEKTIPYICFCAFNACLRRLLHPEEKMELPTRRKWFHRPMVSLIRFCDKWLVARAMKGAEFQRVVSILTNTVHILVLTGGINVRFWPEEAKKIMDAFRPFLGMVDAIHPECFIPWPMLTRWLSVWAAPYGLLAALLAFVQLQLYFSGTDKLHGRHVMCIVTGGFLHIMLVSHVAEDLKVFDCRWLDDGRLELEPKVKCSFTDPTWLIMFLCASLDLVLVAFLIWLVRRALNKALHYYKTQPKGTVPPFSVSFTKWWCIGFRPHSTKHDQALREVQHGKRELGVDEDWREKVNKHNESIFQKNAQSMGMELRRLINPLLGEGPWPLDAMLDPEANFNQWSRQVSLYVHRMLKELDKTWCITSSFLLTDQDVHVAFKWEWYNLFHKLVVVIIELLMTKYQWWGARCIMLGQSIYIAFFIWVRPYKNPALNTIDAVLGIMLCVIIYCVILEEGKDEDLTTEDIGPNSFIKCVEYVHIAMVFCVMLGALGTGVIWLISWLQSTFLQETFYIFQPAQASAEDDANGLGSSAVCTVAATKMDDLQMHGTAAFGKGKVYAVPKQLRLGAAEFKPEWKIIGEEGNDDSHKLPIKQSLMMPCGSSIIYDALNTKPGNVVEKVIGGLPKGSGMRLARGGDLPGRLVVTLRGKWQIGAKWVKHVVTNLDAVRNFKRQSRYELRNYITVAGICVPGHASLKAVGFQLEDDTDESETHWVTFDRKENFVEKYEREFRRVVDGQGVTFLSFMRHGKQDLQLELCEEIVRSATNERNAALRCRREGVTKDLDAAIEYAQKQMDSKGDKIKLDLRFKLYSHSGRNPRHMIPAHVQNQDGREDSDVFILERNRQEWICRGEEVRYRLGLRSAIRDATSLSDLNRLLERSVWQTNDLGLVVVNTDPDQIAEDKTPIVKVCNGTLRLSTEKLDESSPSIEMVWEDGHGRAVLGFLVENKKIYWSGDHEDLPQGPWTRVTSAFDGVPGPDSGLWRAKTSRYVKMDRGKDFLKVVDAEAKFHSTVGAKQLHEKTMNDLHTTQRWTLNAFGSSSLMDLPEVTATPGGPGEYDSATMTNEKMEMGENPNLDMEMPTDGGAVDLHSGKKESVSSRSKERRSVHERVAGDGPIVWVSVDPRNGQIQFYPREVQEQMETAWQNNLKSLAIKLPVEAMVYLEHDPFQVTGKGGVRSVRRHKLADPSSNHITIGIMVRPGTNSYWAKDPVAGMSSWGMQREADAPDDIILRDFMAQPEVGREISTTV